AVDDYSLTIRSPFRAAAKVPVLRDPPKAGAVGANQINVHDVKVFPPSVTFRKTAATVGGKSNPFPVRGPGGPEIAAGPRCERFGLVCVQVEYPQVRGASGACAHEDHVSTVGRKCGLIVKGWMVSETFQARAVRMYAI